MEYLFGKDDILAKLRFKGLNYCNFTFLIITKFKTDRYLNNWNTKTEKIPNVTLKFFSHVRTRLLNTTWSNLRFNV